MRKTPFVPDEYYHIYSRTILNVPEFRDNRNAERLTQAFLIANSTKSSEAFLFLKNNKNATINDAIEIVRQGEKLVDVLCYAIMPDHYHLLVRELKDKYDFVVQKAREELESRIDKQEIAIKIQDLIREGESKELRRKLKNELESIMEKENE